MKKAYLTLCYIALTITHSLSQDTFSIVAVDTATGEVGSAGASCIAGSIIISDVHPGRGAIHTQAWWRATNQNNAKNIMDTSSFSPQEIINWLVANDAQSNPTLRQYGIIDFDSLGNPRTAAYTGVNTDNWKGHITGFNYSIQGNILLGSQILDSIEARFINTPGNLACKLMSALQGANVPGADTRCLVDGTSSISAFIRVANTDSIYLDLNINNTNPGVEPIDLLQVLFNANNVPTASISGNTPFCPGDSIMLIAGTEPYATYIWSTGSTAQSIYVDTVGTYTLIVTHCAGTTDTAEVTTSFALPPQVSVMVNGNTVFCEGDSVVLIASGGATYLWSDGTASSTLILNNVSQSGDHWVIAYNMCGDSVISDTTTVTIIPRSPTPTITVDLTDPNILISNATTGNQWYRNSTPLSINGTNQTYNTGGIVGIYTVIVTDTATGCSSLPSDVQVISGINEIGSGMKFNLYPNPTTGQFTLKMDIQKKMGLSINLYQIDGQILYNKDMQNLKGSVNHSIDLSKYAKGMYYLKIVTDESVITRKVIYQ